MKLTTILRLFGCAAAAASLLSCGNGSDAIFGSKDNYVIGISQCSEDSWRQKLKEELEMATYFNEGVSLRFVSANDDSELQQRQIDSLAESGIDLLIVSPNQLDLLSDEIDKVYDAGIPVILFDRKTDSPKYTSFVGTDNFQIGEMIGHFLAGKLGGKGNVVEIAGLSGSSPALERHNGFAKAIGEYPGIRIVGFANGDWTQESGEAAMNHILEDQCRGIMKKYDLQMLILTCGTHGSYVFYEDGKVSFQPTPKVNVADTVGAGDSFTGAFVASVFKGASVEEAHRKAVAVSAFVCTQNGAMPAVPAELL